MSEYWQPDDEALELADQLALGLVLTVLAVVLLALWPVYAVLRLVALAVAAGRRATKGETT